jgi:chromatin remodeling complex protein RSC6
MPKGSGLTKSYKLSQDLADIVGKSEATRGEIIKQLWAYIKEHKLQDPDNKQYFKPDMRMSKIFGTEKMRGFAMAKHLGQHLS